MSANFLVLVTCICEVESLQGECFGRMSGNERLWLCRTRPFDAARSSSKGDGRKPHRDHS
eukprot:CAMPEP_0180644342 /NCGR_PEP_ID=MMETSP1037_2-20121125/48358_1 /TAXON_ID=632150 /ORGANISM="Azadinium spinosum, Strain 3D9" /LENGTH=59 /DNA_ID=CAMNT_0022668033 /DNA_START=115 /DNA_END=290 /DNA_ORIENTATION=-